MEDWGELESYLDDEQRLALLPSGKGNRQQRELALVYLASKFDYQRDYAEREINEILNYWHTFSDPSTLRRELIMARLLGREKDGSRYWRVQHDSEEAAT